MIRCLSLLTTAAFAAVLGAALAAPAQAQRERAHARDWDRGEGESRIDTTLALDRDGTVDLSLVSGEIHVSGWDRDEAHVRAVSERGILRFDATSTRIEVSVHGNQMGDTRYDVTVPVGTRVLMHSVSGDLSVAGVKGEVEANSVSGDIQITDVAARVSIESVSGSVTVHRVDGSLHGSSVSGDLEIDGVDGEIEAQSVSGDITLRDVHARFAHVHTTSGEVVFDGTIDPAGRYDFGSHSGDIRLTIPPGTGATLSVETFSGDVESAIPMTLLPGPEQRTGHPRRMQFTFGDGGARIDAQTFSGDIRIVQRGRRDQDDR